MYLKNILNKVLISKINFPFYRLIYSIKYRTAWKCTESEPYLDQWKTPAEGKTDAPDDLLIADQLETGEQPTPTVSSQDEQQKNSHPTANEVNSIANWFSQYVDLVLVALLGACRPFSSRFWCFFFVLVVCRLVVGTNLAPHSQAYPAGSVGCYWHWISTSPTGYNI